jgi:hypothetical protein
VRVWAVSPNDGLSGGDGDDAPDRLEGPPEPLHVFRPHDLAVMDMCYDGRGAFLATVDAGALGGVLV